VANCKDSYDGMDQLVCMAQCMCGVVPKKDEMPEVMKRYVTYQIRYCRVPSEEAVPYTSDTKVESIEEIIEAINTTLLALKQTGALAKRNETKEFLDTSLKDKDFAKGFVFSVNVTTKASTDSGNKEQAKEDKAAEKEQQGRALLQSDAPGSEAELNKYVVGYDDCAA
jgi:hypothetical protein